MTTGGEGSAPSRAGAEPASDVDRALKYGHGPVAVRTSMTVGGVCVEIESPRDGPNDEERRNSTIVAVVDLPG